MTEIRFIHPDGSEENIDAPDGESVMDAAFDVGVEGLLGDCGGNVMCATCHVFVDAAHLGALPPMGIAEDGMLDTTATPRRADSRLSCQIVVDDDLAGATFELPASQ